MKKLLLTVLIFMAIVGLAGCARSIAQPVDGNEVTLNFDRVSMEKYDSFGDSSLITVKEISLFSDGIIIVRVRKKYDENGDDYIPGNAPVLEMSAGKVSQEELTGIAKRLSSFGDVPDHIETGVADGHFTFVEVETAEGTLSKGGLVAEQYGPQKFTDICDNLKKLSENAELLACTPLLDLVDPALLGKIEESPPVEVICRKGSGAGGELASSKDPAIIAAVSDAIQALWIGSADAEEHSDDYVIYIFVFSDGTKVYFEFQSGMLTNGDKLFQTWGYENLQASLG